MPWSLRKPASLVLMHMDYRDTAMRRDDPHPFRHPLSIRTTVVSKAQPGLVVADAGIKEVDMRFGRINAQILKGNSR